jgi:tetratricopeptide (TPR) repeat protein
VIALQQASDRDQVFDVLLRATRSKARFAALLSVHPDHIRGRKALAEAGFDSDVSTLRIARETVPAFEEAVASQAPAVGPVVTGEPFIDELLASQLGHPGSATLVLPVMVGTRTVSLLVAHRGNEAMTLADVSDLIVLVSASNPVLARVGKERARTVAVENDDIEVEVSYEGVEAKRDALASAREQEQWFDVADAIRALIREGVEHGDPAEDEQLDLYVELGRVEAERMGRPDRAIEALRRAHAIDAGDTRVLDALHGLYVAAGRWAECVELLEQRIALTEGRRQRIAMLLELASITSDHLDDDERAIAAYEKILKAEPQHEVAAVELERLYEVHREWGPLADLLLERARRADLPEVAIPALEGAAQLYEEKLGDARNAFFVWLERLRRDPETANVIDHLDRLAPAVGAWDEIAGECGVIAEQLEHKHPAAAAQLLLQIARWMRDRLANTNAAVRLLERALALIPDDLGTLFELMELLRGDGRWMRLVELLSERVELEQDPARQSEMYAELGEIHETHLEDPTSAIAMYEQALELERESPNVLVALHRVFLATEAWAELGQLLPRLIDALADNAPRAVVVELQVELGTILGDRLKRPEEAVFAFREALALDPQNEAAFAGLEKVLSSTHQTVALLDAREAMLDAGDRDEQLERYGELAMAWFAQKRFDRAAASWRKLIALDPEDLAAHQGLVQALRAGPQRGSLVVALHSQLKLVTDPAERIALLLELAGLFETLEDVDGAGAAYREIVAIDPKHHAALDALAQLYDRAGRVQPALEVLHRLLEDAGTDTAARGDLLQRIGHVHLGAHDAVNARLSFAQALGLDLNNARAREGMARVHVAQGELVAAGEELIKAAQLSTREDDVVRCLADAAWLYRHRLVDNTRARECLLMILELDPDHADAKQALAELLQDTQQWESLWPRLQQEIQRVESDDETPDAQRQDVYVRAARCAVELGKLEEAITLFDNACAMGQTPPILLDRADALYRAKRLDAAADAYHGITARHLAALDRAQLSVIYRRLAIIHTELGKLPQAQLYHHKVLDLEPAHRETLNDLTELHLVRAHHDEAIATLRTLAGLGGTSAADRAGYLERIGDLYRDKLDNRPRAMSTYLDALELDAGNRRVLQRILDLQSETGQWKAAVDTIGRFLEHETDPARRAAYLLASAEIRRSELKDKPGAIEHYELALDELFREVPLTSATRARAIEAFRNLEAMIAADDNWKYLEQSYRRMIKRLPKDDPDLMTLWSQLGDIYRDRLQHYQSAIEAYEVAHALDPDKSTTRARRLAELYAAVGRTQPTETSERAAKLVETDPTNPDAYRALGRTSHEAGRVDEAWCVARALVFLKQANSQEMALYRQYQPHEVRKAPGILDEDAWANVRHPDEDRTISAIFGLIWEGIAALRSGPAKSFELKPKERMRVENDTRVVAKIFKHAARVVNVSLPDVYVQPRRAGRLMLASVLEKGRLAPAVIVGRDLMTGYRDTEIAASVGAMLALLRPPYYAKLALSSADELEAALAAAGQLVGKKLGRPQLEPLIAQFLPELQKRVTRPTAEAMHILFDRIVDPDLTRWRNAVDAAAQRAALVVAGELAATARMVASESGGVRPSQRVQELVAYSVSPSYFAVRRHLGVSVS